MQPAPKVPWRLATTCALVLTVVFAVQQSLVVQATPPSFPIALERQLIIWGLWLALTPLVVAAARRYPIIDAPRKRWLLRQLALATAFALIHSFAVSIARHALGIAVVGSVVEGALNLFFSQPGRNYLTYAFISAAYHAVAYHRAVRERDLRAVRLEVDLAEAKLATLEGRLRPHFLFNTLNTVAALVREDPAAAERMIGQLSELLRASLRTDIGREVPLDDELHLVEQYLAIEETRFQSRLHATIVAGPDARAALIPQLLLQPLVENAVRHGIAPREAGGMIIVAADCVDDRLRLIVEDDGVGMGNAPRGQRGSGIGLDSVRSRLRQLYGTSQRVEIDAREPSGTRVTIELPYRRTYGDLPVPVG